MRTNPAPVLVPCHRVVAARGGLGGYAGAAGTGQALEAAPAISWTSAGSRGSRTPAALRIKRALLALESPLVDAGIGDSALNSPERLQSTSASRR